MNHGSLLMSIFVKKPHVIVILIFIDLHMLLDGKF